ncbi:MAG TPA: hypothetical protein VFI90_10705 [Rubrobacter sp.]|nr:hypothetical protein [Rubrobacter sp.]
MAIGLDTTNLTAERSQTELDRAAYKLARDFLTDSLSQLGVEDASEVIERYLHVSAADRPETISGLYLRILESGQSAERKAKVIGGAIGGVSNLKPVLCDFEPALVLEKYASEREVFEDIMVQLQPRGSINRTAKGLWPMYCRTILSGAKFLSQFSSAKDFYNWVDFFDDDERARPALPMLVAQEIYGIGFALACDFLKELGYKNFSKPDVQIKNIFPALGLCPFGASDYEVFKAIARVGRNAGVTPYNVDKLFWLVGSGNLYEDEHIGKNGRIGSRKKAFIALARPALEQLRAEEAQRYA